MENGSWEVSQVLAASAAGMEGDPTSFSTDSGRQVSGASDPRPEGNHARAIARGVSSCAAQAIDASAVGVYNLCSQGTARIDSMTALMAPCEKRLRVAPVSTARSIMVLLEMSIT